MHDSGLFIELSLLIILVMLVSVVMRLLKQPLILGYITAGLIVGTAVPLLSGNTLQISPHGFDIFSSLGIVLLLFIIGLELRISVLKQLGPVVFAIALAILLVLGGIGQVAAMLLGFTFIDGVIVGLALFFSSTIIIVKILSDKKEHTRLHGQITIGVILLDDIVATLALLFVAAGKNGGLHASEVGFLFLKGILLVGVLSLVAVKLLPKLSHQFAKAKNYCFCLQSHGDWVLQPYFSGSAFRSKLARCLQASASLLYRTQNKWSLALSRSVTSLLLSFSLHSAPSYISTTLLPA